MDDLMQWLRAQLDDDERIARAVEDRSAPWDGQWMADGNSAVRTLNGHVLFYRHDERPLKPGLTEHVAEHDPARVLREIDAKRKLIKRFVEAKAFYEENSSAPAGELHGLWYALRLAALPYANCEGYREEWSP